MGRKRQDRTMEEWTTHGRSLLAMMDKKHRLYKVIDTTLSNLMTETDELNMQETIRLLNSYKDEVGEAWLRWAKKIKQQPKDENRSRFYIDDSTFERILGFIGLSKEDKKLKAISDNRIFSILFQHLSSFGVNNVNEMYNLLDELNKFGAATSERNSKDTPLLGDRKYSGNTNAIIHAIISELKRNNINNFEKLKSIRRDIRNDKIDELTMENSRLNKIISNLNDGRN